MSKYIRLDEFKGKSRGKTTIVLSGLWTMQDFEDATNDLAQACAAVVWNAMTNDNTGELEYMRRPFTGVSFSPVFLMGRVTMSPIYPEQVTDESQPELDGIPEPIQPEYEHLDPLTLSVKWTAFSVGSSDEDEHCVSVRLAGEVLDPSEANLVQLHRYNLCTLDLDLSFESVTSTDDRQLDLFKDVEISFVRTKDQGKTDGDEVIQ